MLLHTKSYARAGLLGNPSDGYFGKTISFTMTNFCVDLVMYESPQLQLKPAVGVDDSKFTDIEALVTDVQAYGYYGGIRLLKATTRIFFDYCRESGYTLPKRNFTVEYESNIPRLVGMSGSSAICTAMFRSLLRFYEVSCPKELIPTLCWKAELEELNIQCGLQDRVAQVYGGLVFMDFNERLFNSSNHGAYVPLAAKLLPNVYLAYDPQRAEVSGRYHKKLRVLFEEGKKDIVAAMVHFADFAQKGYDALVKGETSKLHELINANFDLRDEVFNVSDENRLMVMEARKSGASAKFAGSGGAIVGSYKDEKMFRKLKKQLEDIGCIVIKPKIAPSTK